MRVGKSLERGTRTFLFLDFPAIMQSATPWNQKASALTNVPSARPSDTAVKSVKSSTGDRATNGSARNISQLKLPVVIPILMD